MINNNEILNCIMLGLEKIISKNPQEIEKICKESKFPAKYVMQEIEVYPGNISYPKQVVIDNNNVMIINENNLLVYFNLWFDEKESDLIVTFHITKNNNCIDFYIDEVHVH